MFYFFGREKVLDTVNLTYREYSSNFLEDECNYIELGNVCYHELSGGRQTVTGFLGDLRISISKETVKVYGGSLCKWYLGDNYHTMRRADIKEAIENLSDAVHVDMSKAIVSRLDWGTTMCVDYPPDSYFSYLGELSRAKRTEQQSSIYYFRRSGAEVLTFYDKNREQRGKKGVVPQIYRDKNMLRYEQRFEKRLSKILKVSEVTGAMLYDESFYYKLVTSWAGAYKKIQKVNDKTFNLKKMGSVKDWHKICVLDTISRRCGGIDGFLQQIADAQKRGEINRKQAYALRKDAIEANKEVKGLIVQNEGITELNRLIDEAVQTYL